METLAIQKPSRYQIDIHNTISGTNHNIVTNATAGSGKTTTIVEGSKLISRKFKILFLAFNKSIVEELKKRLPKYIEVATLHSKGFGFLRSKTLDHQKDFSLLASIIPETLFKKKKQFYSYVYNLVDFSNFVRVNFTVVNDASLTQLAMKYGMDISPEIISHFKEFWKLREYQRNTIDFTDMLFQPVLHGLVKPQDKYDVIFVDELQDLNTTQILFVEQLLKENGRLIGVGDPWQSIYGFAGADTESFSKILTRKNTIELPLSISYRCSKAIVTNAQAVNPGIEMFEDNEEGEVREGSTAELKIGDMVICRNNLPLLEVYFACIRNGVKATIIGKEIEDGLRKIVKLYDNLGYTALQDALMADLSELRTQIAAHGHDNPEKSRRYQEFLEKIKCINAIIDYAKSQSLALPISKLISIIFKQEENAVKLLTIHKSKGLEATRVFLIMTYDGKYLLPSQYAEQDWEQLQEKHLEFVALTRAKKALIFLYL